MDQRTTRTLLKSRRRTAAVASAAVVALGSLVARSASAEDLKDWNNPDVSKQSDVMAEGTCTAAFTGCSGAATVDCDLTKDEYPNANFQLFARARVVDQTTGAVTYQQYGPLHNALAVNSTTSATFHLPALTSQYHYEYVLWKLCDDGIWSVPSNVVCDTHTDEFKIDNGKC